MFLGIGSNHNREQNVQLALQRLQAIFGEIRVSPVYVCEPYPAKSLSAQERKHYSYFNLVVEIATDMPLPALKERLRGIEQGCGRERKARLLVCALDIDVLLYGEVIGEVDGMVLPHPNLDRLIYVLLPLARLAPELQHPLLKQSMADLWQAFEASVPEAGRAALQDALRSERVLSIQDRLIV